MKKLIKKITALSAVLALSFATMADSAIFNPTSTAVTSVLTSPVAIQQVTFNNAAVAAITVTLYDSPTNSTTWLNSAYTNNVYTLVNRVSTNTTINGVVSYTTNKTLVSTLTAVGATTNNYRTLYIVTIPASSSTTWTPPQAQFAGFGVAGAASATNVTATITYLPTL